MPAPLVERLHQEAARAASPRMAALLREAAVQLVKKQVQLDSIFDSVAAVDLEPADRLLRVLADFSDATVNE